LTISTSVVGNLRKAIPAGASTCTFEVGSGFGRFIPANFDVTLNAPAFAPACGTLSDVGQTFTYSTVPVITVTARSGTNNRLTNAKTTNYAGAYMKLTNASLTGKSYTSASGSLNATGVPVADPVIGYNGDGITVPRPAAGTATLTFNSGTGLFFTRTTLVAPFNADIALSINVIDGDNVNYASNPAAFGAATAGNGIAFSPVTANQMRFGRLALGNAFGSELLDLPIPMQTQYLNSSGVYITSVDDNCTSIARGNLVLSSATPTVGGRLCRARAI
jgi:MSHA biogenesis protein MshQ